MIWLTLLSVEHMEKGKETKAGILLGASILIKPYTLIFLPYYLVNKNYKAFVSSIIVFAIGLGAPFLLGIEQGVNLYKSCFHLLNTTSNDLYNSIDNVSIWSFYYKYLHRLALSKILSIITISAFYIYFLYVVYKKIATTAREYVMDGGVLLALIPLFHHRGGFIN